LIFKKIFAKFLQKIGEPRRKRDHKIGAAGANPMTSSYNASDVIIYNATSSRLRLVIKKYFLLLWKTL
jgi:hypothetical protein